MATVSRVASVRVQPLCMMLAQFGLQNVYYIPISSSDRHKLFKLIQNPLRNIKSFVTYYCGKWSNRLPNSKPFWLKTHLVRISDYTHCQALSVFYWEHCPSVFRNHHSQPSVWGTLVSLWYLDHGEHPIFQRALEHHLLCTLHGAQPV